MSDTETATSWQWKYSYYSGGPYDNEISGATESSYVPNFFNSGINYIVCASTKNGETVVSNEVKIKVSYFTEQTDITLPEISYGSTQWGDYDNDGDLDILLAGQSSSVYITKIYKNNGSNTFEEQTGITIEAVGQCSVNWWDYNNDGYLDVLLTGRNNAGDNISKIYKNIGGISFSEQTDISLASSDGNITWGDYDNDGDLDILMASRIYKNNGDNNFVEQTHIDLYEVTNGSVAWIDYDNDGDLDISLSGATGVPLLP